MATWVDRYLPRWLRPYGKLARWHAPIGFWLLFWPCAYSLGLAALDDPARGFDWKAFILMLVGSILMRGAGCTLNDIVDRDIDDKVARTRSRPIPSGQVTTKQAAAFLVVQSLLGLIVLLQFNALTVWLCVGSLVLVAIYPFMKRVTWWPQLFLGLAFSWGALVGWTSQTGSLAPAPLVLYVGSILWVIGYDTIYALQDIEDDALIGVKSTARLFGSRTREIVALFYAGAIVLWGIAIRLAGGGLVPLLGLAVFAGIMAWQLLTLDATTPDNPKRRFVSNGWGGLVLTAAMVLGSWTQI